MGGDHSLSNSILGREKEEARKEKFKKTNRQRSMSKCCVAPCNMPSDGSECSVPHASAPLKVPSYVASAASLRIGSWNVQGIANKWDPLTLVTQRHEVDILGVCEHWMKDSDKHKLGPNSRYVWFGKGEKVGPTQKRGAGGVGFLVDVKVVDMVSVVQCQDTPHSARHMWLKIRCNGNVNIFVGVVYMPVDNSNVAVKNQVLEEISVQCRHLEQFGDVYIVGDFNARIGVSDVSTGLSVGPFGESVKNQSGKILIKWLQEERRLVLNGRENKGGVEYTRVVPESRSVIDYIICSEKVFQGGLVSSLVVAQEEDDFIGSDHRLIFADIKCCTTVKSQGKGVKVVWWKIKEARELESREKGSVVNRMAESLEENLDRWEKKVVGGKFGVDVDSCYSVFKKGLERACEFVVGRRVKFIRKSVKGLPAAFKELYEIRNIVRKEAEVSGSKDLFEMSAKISEKIKDLTSKRNRGKWRSFCESVKAKELGPREFFVLLKKVLGWKSRTSSDSIRNSQGEIVNNGVEVRKVWRDFFEVLGRDDSKPGQFNDSFKLEVERKVVEIEIDSRSHFDERLDAPISEAEVSKHLKALKNFKAAGIDGIRNELLKFCQSESGVRLIARMLNVMWENEKLPSELNVGRIVTLFKGGDVYDCGDYRGISLLSVVYKLLSAIVTSRVTHFCEIENVLADEQGGFRAGRGCADQVFGLYSIVEGRRSENEATYLCFIDIKKAYDRVWRDGLWLRLAQSGIKGKMWRMIRALYASTKSTVFSGGLDSDVFDIDLGVRQGDILSPLVFSIFFNGLIDSLRAKGYGVEVRYRKICGLWYADDIVLFARSAPELRKMLACVDEYCFDWRCAANAKKSGVMIVMPPGQVCPDAGVFMLGGDTVPVVSKYKYLGVLFNDQWSWKDHVEYVLLRTERALGEFEHRFWKNRAVDIETKVIAWKSMFRPAIEYGSEVWWPSAAQLDLFERLQRKVCKWMLGCCVTTSNEVVLGELGLPPLESRFLRARLSFAGSLKCMTPERITFLCSQIDTSGIMKQKLTWSRVISKSLKRVELDWDFGEADLGTGGKKEEVVELWKSKVKVAVLGNEIEKWKERLQKQSKSSLYRAMKESPQFEEYLHLAEFVQFGRLRFNLRSGVCLLNVEKGRRSRNFNDRLCTLCDVKTEETVEHFLFECLKFVDIRSVFDVKLAACCEEYRIPSVVNLWRSNSTLDKARVVLGDCSKTIQAECRREAKPREVGCEVRRISNHFISSLWNARKKLVYSDLASASGAQISPCGSAS